MIGRCPDCDRAIQISDYVEAFRCPYCGSFNHPEYLKPLRTIIPK